MKRKLPFFLVAVLVGVAVLHLSFSRVSPGFSTLLEWMFAWTGATDAVTEPDQFVFASIRTPRMLVAVFGGAALALAG
ncbi:MAG TPA: hypothetical protein EYP98_15570, partial [Planctomycetes bacterium]|nr:hypothetical protein [Planctomycetota bacterium]